MPISRWPAHTYDFHPFPAQGIKQAFALQPGTSALPEVRVIMGARCSTTTGSSRLC